mgnify:CR=1 FL=1
MNNSSIVAVLVVAAALGFIIWFSMGADTTLPAPEEEGTVEKTDNTSDASSAWDAVLSGNTAGEVKKPSAPTTSAPVTPPAARGEDGVYVVTYGNNGFSPVFTQVKAGEAVRFMNNSSRAMMIKSTTKPPSDQVFYSGFSQDSSVGKGGTWTYLFTQVGAWGYTNSNYPSHAGTILVLPQ